MKFLLGPALLVTLLLFSVPAISEEKSTAKLQPGPHGGEVVGDSSESVEVKVSPQSNQVDAYVLGKKKKKTHPDHMAVTLYKNRESGRQIELKPVDNDMDHFRGALPPGSEVQAESSMGFELSFDLPGTGTHKLHSAKH